MSAAKGKPRVFNLYLFHCADSKSIAFNDWKTVNNELKRVWENLSRLTLSHCSNFSLEGLRKSMKVMNKPRRCQGQDLKR